MRKKAIFCQKLKFMYVDVPKCACTSLKQWIYQIEFNKEFKKYKQDNRWIHIHNCGEFHRIVFPQLQLPDKKQDYKIITVIRDPIKRLISAYSNRVIHHKQLSKRVAYSDKIEAANLRFNPDINYFIDNLEAYQDCAGKWTILHHTRPIIDFLGEDIALYTNIYRVEEINQIKEDILLDSNSCLTTDSLPEIPKTQTGGPKFKLDVLKPESFEKLVAYYAKDYEILRDYYPLEKIKEQYISSIRSGNLCLSNNINMLDISKKKQHKEGIEIDSKPPFYIYKSLGDALAKEKKIGEAIVAYQKAIELDSENSTIYRGIGYCYHEANNYPEAIKNYKKAIALEAKQPYWVYLNLANALVNHKQINEAILNYEKAIAIEADNSSLYVNLGNLYLQQGYSDKAFDCYLKSVQLEPNTGISYGKLGYFHNGHAPLSSSQLDKAINCYQKVIAQQPKFFLPYVYLGDSLTAKGNLERAIYYYQIATEKKLLEKYPELTKSKDALEKIEQPNFIIIGAGKSGTSSLYEYICSHPQVISSLKKELRFFNKQNFNKGVDWYLSHFPLIPKEKNLITGEADPGYFGWEVQEAIYSLFPNIKLIAIIRNPVERAFSQYNHWVRDGRERRSFQEAVTSEIEKLEKVFNKIDILELENREKVKEICRQVRKGNSKEKTGYLWEGLYVYFLQKWTHYFSKEQLLVLKSEDFYAQPEVEMKKVFTFLGLPDYRLPQYKKYNAGKYSSIDAQLYGRISKFFQPHNQRLEEYLNKKFNWN